MARKFKPKTTEEQQHSYAGKLPTDKPIAVYYRQSTEAQVGNISTAIQTVDMVAELERRGWKRSYIILIDVDEGISGMKRIDERPGMKQLFELICEGKIGAVACQDEDRLFRDVTQIQVNIFIEACRKAQVQVITPFFTYDFAHPQQGDFHARQFRFKSEMAAEYIKSYIQGRLAPAKRRLAREGRWVGAQMPVGYMVDMRKYLSNGEANPTWRKYVPFEPYATIVRAYFRLFNENGGQIRQTMLQLQKEHISFPDVKPPEGYKVSYKIKWRGDGYYMGRAAFVSLLTNPAYVGHWYYKGELVVWNNHEPIVSEDAFMKAFNRLSRYTFTGEHNPHYDPPYPYVRLQHADSPKAPRPLCSGLIQSHVNNRWISAGTRFHKQSGGYLYCLNVSHLEGIEQVWVRHASWIDEAIVYRLKQRLYATFDIRTWSDTIQQQERLVEQERKFKQSQLSALEGALKNLIGSIQTLTDPQLIQEVEKRYKHMQTERQRLQTQLETLEQQKHQRLPLTDMVTLFSSAVDNWDELTNGEQRNVVGFFVDRIVATDFDRAGNMKLTVSWKDGSRDEIQLWHKTHGNNWSIERIEYLLFLLDEGVSQLEIAAAFPDLKWYQISNEIKRHRGLVRFTPSWLGKEETYPDYVASGGRKGKASGSYWREEELAKLRDMVERQSTQEEIMQEFPYRRWIQIKSRIKDLFGLGVRVPLSGISQRLTYIEYVGASKNVDDDRGSEM